MLKSDTNGFTLIELLLGVTLSAILMMGIVVFVSGTLGSNLATKRTLEDVNKNDSFEQRFMSVLGNITNSGIYASGGTFGGNYNTGIFLSTGGSNLTVTFLGLKTQTGYCDSYSGSASETGTVMLLSLRQFATPSVQNTIPYTISSSENSIFSGTIRVIGTGYPGNDLDTTSGALSELSSPSALVVSGALLYIADTMNDRILSYDTSAGTIQKLLGRENGIEKPTSLFFSGSTLLIASTGNGKIYSLRDGEGNGQTFSSKFHVATDFSANIIRFTFPDIPAITLPSISGDFAFRSDGIPF
jgi:prepilin-type N-terminal cleavage/methylation domain-containing protein